MTADRANYGGGRPLPVHAVVEDPEADLESGLLLQLHRALLEIHDGQIVRIASTSAELTGQLRTFEAVSRHALLSVVPDPGRPGWTLHFLRKGRARTDWPPSEPSGRELGPAPGALSAPQGESFMPTRLWLYTNYDCNLACDYCCVVAGPKADPRRLSDTRFRALVDEAAGAGMDTVFMTGGEPTLRPDIAELMAYVTDRLPLTILTNAMLLRGTRWARIRELVDAGRPIAFQVSLDSATPERHDAHRGRGAHGGAMRGIRTLLEAGARVRLAASLPEASLDEIPRLHQLAEELGIAPGDRIFRPIALRGAAAEGEPIRPQDVAPELTCDAQGWFWHPLSNDPDMRLDVPADAPMIDALAAVRARLDAILEAGPARLDRFVCG